MIFGAVQHVGSVDELVSCTSHSQLRLGVAQNYFTPENAGKPTRMSVNTCGLCLIIRMHHFWFGQDILCITCHGREVQLVFGPEDHVPRPDFQDGWRLEGRGDGEERQLRRLGALAITLLPALAVKELQPALDVQRLRGFHSVKLWH